MTKEQWVEGRWILGRFVEGWDDRDHSAKRGEKRGRRQTQRGPRDFSADQPRHSERKDDKGRADQDRGFLIGHLR